MPSFCFTFVLLVCVLQFFIIMNLLVKLTNLSHKIIVNPTNKEVENSSASSIGCISEPVSKKVVMENKNIYPGAAVFLNLHQPRWFQRRYSMMVQNVINNIPDDWVVQIFWTAEGQSKNGIDINRGGLQRFIDAGKVILTTIPKEIIAVKKKKYELMIEPW